MVSPKAGKIPPFELVPMLYKVYGTSRFDRRKVLKVLGEDAAISMIRALKDGWLQKMRKTDGIYEYVLSAKAMYLVERYVNGRERASC